MRPLSSSTLILACVGGAAESKVKNAVSCGATGGFAAACKASMQHNTDLNAPAMKDLMDHAQLTVREQVYQSQQRAAATGKSRAWMASRLDVGADAPGGFKIIPAPHLLPLAKGATIHTRSNKSALFQLHDSLVQMALPHMRNGHQPVDDQDVFFYACTQALSGGYYPNLHWDTDWYMFPESAGFQIWYVSKLHDEERMGNMFMADSAWKVAHHPTPLTSEMREGQVVLRHHTTGYPEAIYASCRNCSLADLGIRLNYLDAHEGDILLFSKRQMHMSDPRPTLRGVVNTRRALHGRFVVRQKGARGIAVWSGHPYVTQSTSNLAQRGAQHFMKGVIKKRVIRDEGPNKVLDVSRYEMMGVRHGRDW